MWSVLRDFIHLKTAESNSYQNQFLVADALRVDKFHECAKMFFVRDMAEHLRLVAVKNALEHADLCLVLDVYDLAEACFPTRGNNMYMYQPAHTRKTMFFA
jgi:hypothetical protein